MKQLPEEAFKQGQILLFDKPLKWTSFQLINKVRWLIKRRYKIKKIKVGHAGTLDPLATGLLILCTGKATKQIPGLQGHEKEYTGSFTLGATTPSYDLETDVDKEFSFEHLTDSKIRNATSSFIGDIEQHPPVFSALKKDGKRLYEYARSGQDVKIASRPVTISEFEITGISLPEVSFRVVCSKGTYIRSLAHDFGKHLESGAYLSSLRRTRIGPYKVGDALTIASFVNEYLGQEE